MLAAVQTHSTKTLKICKRSRSWIRSCRRSFERFANGAKILQRSSFANFPSKSSFSFAGDRAIRSILARIMRSAQHDFCRRSLAPSRLRMLRVGDDPPGRGRRSARSRAWRYSKIYDQTKNVPGFVETFFSLYRAANAFVTTAAPSRPSRNSRSQLLKSEPANSSALRDFGLTAGVLGCSPKVVGAAHVFHSVAV